MKIDKKKKKKEINLNILKNPKKINLINLSTLIFHNFQDHLKFLLD